MPHYLIEYDLVGADVPLRNVDALLDTCREVATAELVYDQDQIKSAVPTVLSVVFEVGPQGVAEDLWELRDVVSELQDRMNQWGDFGSLVDKPVVIGEL